MAYVITEGCTKDAACMDACPVDCIHPKKDDPAFEQEQMLHINPEECIDCGVCVPVCPESIIYVLEEVPEHLKQYVERNAAYFKQAVSA